MAGKKILVADDSLTIQKVIRLALSGDGYEIQTVSDGNEAVEQASLFRPDICIIDVSLPTKDAYQIRQEFLSKPDLKNIPIIMMSSAFEKVDELKMNALGFAGHLIKPFDPSHLRSTLLSVSSQIPKQDLTEELIEGSDFPTPMDVGLDHIQQLTKNTFEMTGIGQKNTESAPSFLDQKFKTSEQISTDQEWGIIEPMKEDVVPSSSTVPPGTNLIHAAGNEGAPSSVTVSHEELESLIKTEVSKNLDKMRAEIKKRVEEIFEQEYKSYAQTRMPDIAERVIKDEIHRLLNDPPL